MSKFYSRSHVKTWRFKMSVIIRRTWESQERNLIRWVVFIFYRYAEIRKKCLKLCFLNFFFFYIFVGSLPRSNEKFNHSTFFVFFSALPRATTALWLAREPMLARRNRAWPPNRLRPRWSQVERNHRSIAPLLLHLFDRYAIHSQRWVSTWCPYPFLFFLFLSVCRAPPADSHRPKPQIAHAAIRRTRPAKDSDEAPRVKICRIFLTLGRTHCPIFPPSYARLEQKPLYGTKMDKRPWVTDGQKIARAPRRVTSIF